MASFQTAPPEVIDEIVQCLHPTDLTSLAIVSKYFSKFANDALWGNIELHRHYAHSYVTGLEQQQDRPRKFLERTSTSFLTSVYSGFEDIDLGYKNQRSCLDEEANDHELISRNAQFNTVIQKLYQATAQGGRWSTIAPSVRHLCMTVNHLSTPYIWNIILSFPNLRTIELIGEYNLPDGDKGPPTFTPPNHVVSQNIRSVRLRGYIPEGFVETLLVKCAHSITCLDLGALQAPFRFPGDRRGFRGDEDDDDDVDEVDDEEDDEEEDDEEEDDEGEDDEEEDDEEEDDVDDIDDEEDDENEDDDDADHDDADSDSDSDCEDEDEEREANEFSRLTIPYFMCPTGVRLFQNVSHPHFAFLTHLLLCKRGNLLWPLESDWEDLPVRNEPIELVNMLSELKEWVKLLGSVQGTIVHLELEQRPLTNDALILPPNTVAEEGMTLGENFAVVPDDSVEFDWTSPSDTMFFQQLVEVAFASDMDWPKLKQLTFRGINFCGFEENMGMKLKVWMAAKLPGVKFKQDWGSYMYFNRDRGTIRNENGADGLMPNIRLSDWLGSDGWV